jgi:hypothetical protein
VVTGNQVGKEAMAKLEYLAEPGEMPLSKPKLPSVVNLSITAAMPSFANLSRPVVLAVTVESKCTVAPSSLLRF